MRIMAVDYGAVRTGIAVCDASETIASPVCVIRIPAVNEDGLLQAVAAKAAELTAERIVVGNPLRTDGRDSEMSERASAFACRLAEKSGITTELADERFTTLIASRSLRQAGKDSRRQRACIDAAAAAVLLQDYIDARRS